MARRQMNWLFLIFRIKAKEDSKVTAINVARKVTSKPIVGSIILTETRPILREVKKANMYCPKHISSKYQGGDGSGINGNNIGMIIVVRRIMVTIVEATMAGACISGVRTTSYCAYNCRN